MTDRWQPDLWVLGPSAPYRLNASYEPAQAVLTLTGRLDAGAARALTRLLAVFERLPAPVVVDLHHVTHLGDAGAASLLASMTRRRRRLLSPLCVRHAAHLALDTELTRAAAVRPRDAP